MIVSNNKKNYGNGKNKLKEKEREDKMKKNKSRTKQVKGWKKVNNKWIVEEIVKCLVFFFCT